MRLGRKGLPDTSGLQLPPADQGGVAQARRSVCQSEHVAGKTVGAGKACERSDREEEEHPAGRESKLKRQKTKKVSGSRS